MKKMLTRFGAALGLTLACTPASADYNSTVQGTLTWVEQIGGQSPGMIAGLAAGSIRFKLDNQPTVNCNGWNAFVIPPTGIDESTRKNMLAMLLAAKASGASVVVAYDSTGNGCSNGDAVIYYLRVL